MTTSYPAWMTSKVLNLLTYDLGENSEIPFSVSDNAPDVAQVFDEFAIQKLIPSDKNYIVHKEKGLLSQEVEFIVKRIGTDYPVNVYDLIDTNGEDAIPLLWSLHEQQLLNRYVPVTQSHFLNDNAINKLKMFMLGAGLTIFEYDSILVNMDLSSFSKQQVKRRFDTTASEVNSLFLLTNSTLGNFINPQRILKNIYQSMEAGDYLVILQGIYRNGIEDILVSDYRNLAPTLKIFLDIAQSMNPEAQIQTNWDDNQVNGIKMTFKIDKDTDFAGVALKEQQKITLFRSTRFQEHILRQMIVQTGFKISNIAYDDEMDNALFVVRK